VSDFQKICEECDSAFNSLIQTICDDCHDTHQKNIHNTIVELTKLLEDKDRVIGVMREALEFYKTHGEFRPYNAPSSNFVIDDYGQTARQALEQAEKLNQEESP